jgi:hypothetical protein
MVASAGTAFVVTLDAYTANDCVGGLAKVVYGTGGGGLIHTVKVLDYANQKEPYIIHIYRSTPSTIANDAAFAPLDADGFLEVGTVTVAAADYATANGSAYAVAYKRGDDVNIAVPESCAGTVYVYLQCTDTPDYAAVGDLVVEMFFWSDME